ncbi:hypothetical protein [Bradyrhizobium macuxiense]|uniref:hypothetical protein n=1 Tax=Bradyrhizobium macuxiense TaxID=1755647 RepID=UPI000832639E|nr:hypothetical protein [Bradyrhizobium macuxiense]
MPQAVKNTSLSQFLYTHEKLRNLTRGPLPSDIVEEMTSTARGIAERILEAPASDWRELCRKALVLLDELPREPEWIERIEATLRHDDARLSLADAADQDEAA